MKIKIKRFDQSLPLPIYQTPGSVCVDLYSREEITINPSRIGSIPLNIAFVLPRGYFALLAARSSTHKLGIMPANGIGIGDMDFCGDNDEYKFAALNFTKKKVVIEKGTRIAQLMIVKFEKIEFQEVEKLSGKDRGGFGSTGKK